MNNFLSYSCPVSDCPNEIYSVVVRAGSHTQTGNRVTAFATRGYFVTAPSQPHPNFAVIHLANDLPIRPSIQIIRLPSTSQATSFFDLQEGSVAGWGTPSNSANTILRQSDVVITSQAECSQTFVPYLTIYDLCFRGKNPELKLQNGDLEIFDCNLN